MFMSFPGKSVVFYLKNIVLCTCHHDARTSHVTIFISCVSMSMICFVKLIWIPTCMHCDSGQSFKIDNYFFLEEWLVDN